MNKLTQLDTSGWVSFPHPTTDFPSSPAQLKKRWDVLHAGDREPLPSEKRIQTMDPGCPNPKQAATTLLEAWKAFHMGEFATAVELGDGLGILGHAVANKASGIYADYLEDDEQAQKAIYEIGMKRAQAAIDAFPTDPNAHYFHAFMTGRYSQCISIAQALKDGLANRVKTDVMNALALAPEHGEAHLALGLFHAEVINKVGRVVGGVTHGANKQEAMDALDRAQQLMPNCPIALIEYGNALYLLYGDKKLDESNEAYLKASKCHPRDAMEKLDVEYAKASIG